MGFACNWDPDPATTWSGTAWHLMNALRRHTEIVDVGPHLSRSVRMVLKGLHARRINGQWVSQWKHYSLTRRIVCREINHHLDKHSLDSIIQIGSLCLPRCRYYIVEDMCFDILLDYWQDGRGIPHFPGLRKPHIQKLKEYQSQVHSNAAGIFSLSQWYAARLISNGISPQKIHVMYPGTVALGDTPNEVAVRSAPRSRLLFLGKDFLTKGGDLVVGALQRLARVIPNVSLTVAGPSHWPLTGAIPDNVRFLGRVPASQVAGLIDAHDLFVMPSRLEGFGIVFVEALSRGLPCVGSNACAMPELIVPGVNGDLVSTYTVDAVADAMLRTLTNDAVYANAYRDAPAVQRYFTWDRAALDILAAISGQPAVPRWRPGRAAL